MKTYAQLSAGARYVVVVTGFKSGGKNYRTWDREAKREIGPTYTSKRKCQDRATELNEGETGE